MFKFIAFFALIAVVVAKPGHLATHTVVEQAHVGSVVHSVPSAVSSQHFTRVHNSAIVEPVLAPIVKTIHSAPLLHAAPVVHSAPVLHSASVLHTSVHSAPVLHSASVHHAIPVLHAAPVLHSASVLHSAPPLHEASW